jgi:predicted PurR-regulated permease PerM
MSVRESLVGESSGSDLYRTLAKVVWLAVGAFVLLWFLDAAIIVVLLFVFALIFAVSLNPPVTWLEQRKVPRWAGTLLVRLGILLLTGFLGWLVVPRLIEQTVDQCV